jgi:drug/metabolite transporter (DMT)-like permease
VLLRHSAIAHAVGVGGTALMVAGAGAPYALVAAAGLLYAPAAQAGALIPGVMPLFATLLSVLVLRERVARDRLAGLALIPGGVLLLLGPGLVHPEGERWIGQLLFLTAALMWATYTVTLRRSGLKPLHGAAVVAFWSACLYLPVYLLAPVARGIANASWGSIASQVVFQGVLSSVVSLVAFNRAVALLGASRAAVFASLVPALAAVLAVPVLGETPTPTDVAGIGLVSLGVLLGSGAVSGLWRARMTAPAAQRRT